ncbi:MAG: TQO small subunit DoxD [Mycobacterium leprae]
MNQPMQHESGSFRTFWRWASVLFTPVRWVTGFMFLSAFIRRVINVPAKMDPTSAAYNGKKFADFLPHAIGIKPMLSYLLANPPLLHGFLWTFTIIEALVGLFLIAGFMTRLAAIGSAALSFGILLGSGWLGSTCLDEWQIGVILISTGLAIAIAGSGHWSVDDWLLQKWPQLGEKGWFRWLFSGALVENEQGLKRLSIWATVVAFGITLWSYQVIHNGLWGTLRNDSKTPNLVLTQQVVQADGLVKFNVYRDNGPDTYGSFIVEVQVKDADGKLLEDFKSEQLSKVKGIINHQNYETVKTGPYGITVPLAGNADLTLNPVTPVNLAAGQPVTITVFDVSGAKWSVKTAVK